MYFTVVIPIFTIISARERPHPQIRNTPSFSYLKLTIPVVLLLLSLGGIPPLTGFIPKLLAIKVLAEIAPLTLFILITGSLINLYFYLALAFNFLLISTFRTTPLTNIKSCKGYTINL